MIRLHIAKFTPVLLISFFLWSCEISWKGPKSDARHHSQREEVDAQVSERLKVQTCRRIAAESDPFFSLFSKQLRWVELAEVDLNPKYEIPHERTLSNWMKGIRRFPIEVENYSSFLRSEPRKVFAALLGHPSIEPQHHQQVVDFFDSRPQLERLFLDGIAAATDIQFFALALADLVTIRSKSQRGFDEILSKYEESKGFQLMPSDLPSVKTEEFIKLVRQALVWKEGYTKTTLTELEQLRAGFKWDRMIPLALNLKLQAFEHLDTFPHGAYSHRIQNFLQLRHRDACNHQTGEELDLRKLRSASGASDWAFANIWRVLYDDLKLGLHFGNPHFVNLIAGFVDEDLGKFVHMGTDITQP